jgi:hypothetical protein
MSASPAPAPIPDLAGWTRLGTGGFGVVYRAEDTAHARTVAVKLLAPADLDERALQTFDRERTAMGMLSGHPNIVTVYRSGITAEGRPFIVMDHMAGGSLADAIDAEGPMRWQDAAAVGVRIAAALQAAHGLGVLHRDVKPANILLTAWGEVKLADFGIAAMVSATGTATGGNSASIAHAAPEVLDGRRPSPASDVYSLGSTLHTLVAGTPPFYVPADDSIVPMLARIVRDDPPDLRQVGADDGFAAAVRQALAKDPADRFATAEAFGRRLQQLLRDAGHDVPQMVTDLAPPQPRPATVAEGPTGPVDEAELPGAAVPTDSPARGGTSRRRWPAVAAAAALAVAGGVAAVLLLGGDDDRAAVVATTAAPAAEGGEAVVYRTITDDGPRLAVVTPDGGAPVVLEALGEVGRPALSPDGHRIAVVSGGGLQVVDRSTGAAVALVQGEVSDPAWAPDGTRIVFALDGDLHVVDVDGGAQGEVQQLTDTAAQEGSPVWTATGEEVLYDTDVAGNFDVWALDPSSGETRRITSDPADEETPAPHPTDGSVVVVRHDRDGRSDLVLVDRSGEVVQLTMDLADVGSPSFSPAGDRLVFSSDSRGEFDLWTLEVASGALATLVTDPGHQTDPHWAG